MDFTEVELAFFAAGDALADEPEPVLAEIDDYYAAYVLEVA